MELISAHEAAKISGVTYGRIHQLGRAAKDIKVVIAVRKNGKPLRTMYRLDKIKEYASARNPNFRGPTGHINNPKGINGMNNDKQEQPVAAIQKDYFFPTRILRKVGISRSSIEREATKLKSTRERPSYIADLGQGKPPVYFSFLDCQKKWPRFFTNERLSNLLAIAKNEFSTGSTPKVDPVIAPFSVVPITVQRDDDTYITGKELSAMTLGALTGGTLRSSTARGNIRSMFSTRVPGQKGRTPLLYSLNDCRKTWPDFFQDSSRTTTAPTAAVEPVTKVAETAASIKFDDVLRALGAATLLGIKTPDLSIIRFLSPADKEALILALTPV